MGRSSSDQAPRLRLGQNHSPRKGKKKKTYRLPGFPILNKQPCMCRRELHVNRESVPRTVVLLVNYLGFIVVSLAQWKDPAEGCFARSAVQEVK